MIKITVAIFQLGGNGKCPVRSKKLNNEVIKSFGGKFFKHKVSNVIVTWSFFIRQFFDDKFDLIWSNIVHTSGGKL